jgi:esterase/lipase
MGSLQIHHLINFGAMSKGMMARITGMTLSLLGIIYLLGPSPSEPVLDDKLPKVPSYRKMDAYLLDKQEGLTIKPGCEEQVVWYNDSIRRTRYVLLYLHGFSASHEEGAPIHRNVAKKLKANLYLSRLCEHGLETEDALLNFTADCYWESAKEALMIARSLGDSVFIMSTSTGSTLALLLASRFPYIHSLINMSPNVEVNHPAAWLLTNPWGINIAKTVLGGNYRYVEGRADYAKYWNTKYRVESTVQLMNLVETAMVDETFNNIEVPVYTAYYYKNEEEQDDVVKVEAMLDMMDELGTADEFKRSESFPDAGNHVLASPIVSGDPQSVENGICRFIEEVLKIELE